MIDASRQRTAPGDLAARDDSSRPGTDQTAPRHDRPEARCTMSARHEACRAHMSHIGVWGDRRGRHPTGFDATAKINCKDSGVTWNKTLELGGGVVGDHAKVELEVQAIEKS
jgi:hypothetical protein